MIIANYSCGNSVGSEHEDAVADLIFSLANNARRVNEFGRAAKDAVQLFSTCGAPSITDIEAANG